METVRNCGRTNFLTSGSGPNRDTNLVRPSVPGHLPRRAQSSSAFRTDVETRSPVPLIYKTLLRRRRRGAAVRCRARDRVAVCSS